MSSMSMMEPVEKHEYRTLNDLRVRAKLTKAQVYRGVGVAKSTYQSWESGKTFPDLPRAVALAKVLKAPLDAICTVFGLDLDGIPASFEEEKADFSASTNSDKEDYDALIRVLKQSPNDDAAAIIRLIINKKNDGSIPPSGLPI